MVHDLPYSIEWCSLRFCILNNIQECSFHFCTDPVLRFIRTDFSHYQIGPIYVPFVSILRFFTLSNQVIFVQWSSVLPSDISNIFSLLLASLEIYWSRAIFLSPVYLVFFEIYQSQLILLSPVRVLVHRTSILV